MDNDTILQGQWDQLKGQIRQQWGKLTDDDVERIHGERQELVGILKERYGRTEKEIEAEVADFLDSVNSKLQGEPA
ncbi:MAG: CsbD family protein [Anaerolineae bacterium]|nr:CsbD family protein [Anaerolineae bacterium]MCO5191466.1 CsbD family protein [Anaerolineae bacterium]